VPRVWQEHDLRYEGWRVAAGSAASLFFASLIIYTFAPFLKPLAAEFSWTREEVSAAYSMMAIGAASAAPCFGYILDRVSARRVVVPCMAVVGCCFSSLTLLDGRLWQFLATFGVLGVAATALSPVGYSRAVSTWFQERRGLALGVVIGGGAVAGMVQAPLAQWIIGATGWRTAYVLIGAAILLIGAPIAALTIREKPHEPGSVAVAATGTPLNRALRSRVYWTVVLVFFASSVAQNGAIVHLAALLTDRGVSAASGALAISVMGGASLMGRLITGWLLDRFFGGAVSFLLLALAATGTYLLTTADSFATGALAAALIGFGMGGEVDVTPYLLSRYFGLRTFSTLYGFAFAASALAGATGPILLGRTFDATGSYDTLLPKIAGFMLVVAPLMLTLPRYELRTHPLSRRRNPEQTSHEESGGHASFSVASPERRLFRRTSATRRTPGAR
jgi:MFS family permease